MPELNFRVAPGDQSVAFDRDSYLTDDPLVSRAKLCTVKAETDIFYLGSLNDEWAYVMVETADGRWMCGFMPHEDIQTDDARRLSKRARGLRCLHCGGTRALI